MFIKKASLINTEMPVYTSGSNLDMEIIFDSEKDMTNLCLRMPLFYCDGTIVGMATTSPSICCSRKVENRVFVRFNTTGLAPGNYSIRLVMYSVNEFGTTQTHDVVDEAVIFEICGTGDEANSIEWNHKYWGAIQFPKIEIISSGEI